MKKKILVIEDDLAIAEALQELLESEGYSVILAEHGLSALNYLEGKNALPSLILLDLMMPIMDGRNFLAEFERKLPEMKKSIPVLLMSAMGEQSLPKNYEKKMTISKPLDIDGLMNTIKAFI